MKPWKGNIYRWRKSHFDKEKAAAEYGEDVGLGYIIVGTVRGHPVFGDPDWFRTSWVMKHDEETGEIETRNSRYTLVGVEVSDA